MAIHAGYMGWADIGGTKLKITGGSLNPVQALEAPELVQGDFNRKGVNYGKIETGGNVTGDQCLGAPLAQGCRAQAVADRDTAGIGKTKAHKNGHIDDTGV